jgi:iron-sulfur cluster assembly protein
MNITVTKAAKDKILTYIQDGSKVLRITVVPGGCAGHTFGADLSSASIDDEVIYEAGAIKIVSDQKSMLFFDELSIDYSQDLIQSGFKITSSGASGSCGCGASFSV